MLSSITGYEATTFVFAQPFTDEEAFMLRLTPPTPTLRSLSSVAQSFKPAAKTLSRESTSHDVVAGVSPKRRFGAIEVLLFRD